MKTENVEKVKLRLITIDVMEIPKVVQPIGWEIQNNKVIF